MSMHIDCSVKRTTERVSNLIQEVQSYKLRKRRRKSIDVIGDWGVGKDSLVLKILDKDIPDPKLEQDHPSVQRGTTKYIPNLNFDEIFDLTIRIIPGKYIYREKEKNFFDYIRPGDYEVDALVFCFALNCSTSFYNLETKWIPKAKIAFVHNMPMFILVGTKCDLPEVDVTKEQAKHLRAITGAVNYSKSSAHKNLEIVRIRNMLLNILTYPKMVLKSTRYD